MTNECLEAALRCAEQLGPVLPCCWPAAARSVVGNVLDLGGGRC